MRQVLAAGPAYRHPGQVAGEHRALAAVRAAARKAAPDHRHQGNVGWRCGLVGWHGQGSGRVMVCPQSGGQERYRHHLACSIGVISAHPAGVKKRNQPTGSAHGSDLRTCFATPAHTASATRPDGGFGGDLQSLTAPGIRAQCQPRTAGACRSCSNFHGDGHRPAKLPDTGEPMACLLYTSPSPRDH